MTAFITAWEHTYIQQVHLIVRSGVISSSTEVTNNPSSMALVLWPCLGIWAEMTFGFSGASNSISFALMRSYILFFRAQQLLVSLEQLNKN